MTDDFLTSDLLVPVWVLATAIAFATVGSWLGVRGLIGILARRDMVDRPNDRTLHQGAIPRGGGIVIAVCILLGLLLAAVLTQRYEFFTALALLMCCWSGLSWRDDQVDLSPKVRLAAQIAIAVLTVLVFGWVSWVGNLNIGWLGAIASVIGLIWMANLYNFMDGIDGLAASQSIIASITLAFWFYMAGNGGLALVCAIVAASSYGFLWWNWHPAKIFMGDVGSVTLGAFFGTMIIIAANRHGFPILSLLLLFAVFISDASITIATRIYRRERFWLPHRQHFYQRAAALGIPHSRIATVAIVLMLLSSLIATLSVLYRDIILAAIMSIALILSGVAIFIIIREMRQEN